MDKLTIILGAGFSYKAGLPLAKDIEPFFLRDNTEKLLHFLSGEWKWTDYASESDLTNGKLSSDWLAYGYILNVLVAEYVNENGSFENYEAFYQYIIDNSSNRKFLEGIYKKAKDLFDKKGVLSSRDQFYQEYTRAFNKPDPEELMNLVNHLIDDLLYWRKTPTEVLSSYKPFLQYIETVKDLNVITLNHDLLLEFLLESIPERPYSDGFSYQNTVLFSTDEKPIRTYSGDFGTSIKIIKLHGSIDQYRYNIAEEIGVRVIPNGEYIYFKTQSFQEKQRPVRKDSKSGEVVQKFHSEISPQFITGTRKEDLIATDYLYRSLYELSESTMLNSKTLLIIGYSYADAHVNKLIQDSLKSGNLKKVINVNPFTPFPYSFGGLEIANFSDINELISHI